MEYETKKVTGVVFLIDRFESLYLGPEEESESEEEGEDLIQQIVALSLQPRHCQPVEF